MYRYAINFAPDCWVGLLRPEVTWRNAPFVDESATLLRGAYTCHRDEVGGYHVQIERNRAVVETRYALKWLLPQGADLRRARSGCTQAGLLGWGLLLRLPGEHLGEERTVRELGQVEALLQE